MKFGIATSTIIPLRRDPMEQSEMVSQVLFGEIFNIIEKKRTWYNIQLTHDNYEGWIDEKMFEELDQESFDNLNTDKPKFATDLIVKAVCLKTKQNYNLVAGSIFRFYDKKRDIFKINNTEFQLSDKTEFKPKNVREGIVEFAKLYHNAPYLWGGRSPFGIDCSGLTQIAYRVNGIDIPRDARQQVALGRTLNLSYEAKPGDLAFFENNNGEITHTGIVLENDSIIHASGKVRIDRLDHQGIYNMETKKYSHKLRIIQNIID